tara:strand:+ start:4558 stop:4923 length:366 start_codon:yes stop_codon:yes gene_type:complete
MEYDHYLKEPITSEYVSIVVDENNNKGIKSCDKCGGEFIPKNALETNTESSRCKGCLSLYSFLEDSVNGLCNKLINIKRDNNKMKILYFFLPVMISSINKELINESSEEFDPEMIEYLLDK